MSDEEMMGLEELRDLREKEALIELGKLKYDDGNRQKVFNEWKGIAEVRNNDMKVEQARLDSNTKNELDEERLAIDKAKVKAENKRFVADLLKIVAAVGIGIGGNYMSYRMDEVHNAYKDLKMEARNLKDKFLGKL